jgi:TolB protein
VRPAGDRIAFQAGRPGHQQLYLIGLDGTGRRALTTGESDNTAPDVSPDGAKIVFASVRETSPGQRARSDIFEMNLDGTGERQLIANPRADDSPQYSADGRSVYFLRDEGGSPPTKRVIRMDLATRVETPLTPTGSFVRSFSVSADGGRIALTTLGANNAVVMAIYDTATQALTPVAAAAGEVLASPAYRPATPQPR